MRSAWLLSLLALACGTPPAAPSRSPEPLAPPRPPEPIPRPPAEPAPTTPKLAAGPVTVTHVAIGASTRRIGSLVTTTAPDGAIAIALVVSDNGRGPKVDATLRLAADGTIAQLQATGNHEIGAPLDERFAREGDAFRWKSHEEAGLARPAAPAFYVPIAHLPYESLLVPAALKAGGTLALLPAGTATVEPIGEATVSASGQTRRITGYAIHGLDLAPLFTWMNADGTWFGTAHALRLSLVPEGWDAVIPTLTAKQDAFLRERDQRLAAAHAHRPPAAGLAYTSARVLDVLRGRWLERQTVLVVGDTIRAVGPAAKVAIPPGAEVVDLAGRALVPGLVDMHQHTDPTDGVLAIASGVTTLRDVGGDPDTIDDLARRYDAGAAIGPHLVRFGFIEGRGEKAASMKITAETADEAKAGVEFYAGRGYAGIKIYNSVRPELVPVITAAAHARGMQVTGHVPVHMLAHEAVQAGFDGIEHINMVFLNFLATHETETRDRTRFTLVGDRAASLDLRARPVQDFFALLRAKRTVITPTLAVFEPMFVAEGGQIPPGLEDLAARLPVMPRRRFLMGGLPVSGPEQRAQYRAAFTKQLAMVKALYDAKVVVALGTDHIAGLMLHHELELFSRAGIPNAAILQLATLGAARAMRTDGKVGTIAPGRRADLAVIDGDPLADIRAIRAVTSTMRAGVVYPSAPLYEAVGVRPAAGR
ncbi:MAG TPA: amidohydrolase family protein [Kofleriaceae bacterium]|nr:amidohydrolase family protein [Kofleriaceae bacterium]